MLLAIPDVLSPLQVKEARDILDHADWVDGRVTAGHQAVKAKDNMQLPQDSTAARQLGDMILKALSQNPLFVSAALPLKVYPPMFNRYSGGQSFGTHVDNAIRHAAGGVPVRTDLSATLFFAGPEEYDGGELCIEDTYGVKSVKLPAGHMILYPSTSLHHVKPVTRGARVCSFFWMQSMVRDDAKRTIMFDLDSTIQRITREHPDSAHAVVLTGIYHNLLRQWAET